MAESSPSKSSLDLKSASFKPAVSASISIPCTSESSIPSSSSSAVLPVKKFTTFVKNVIFSSHVAESASPNTGVSCTITGITVTSHSLSDMMLNSKSIDAPAGSSNFVKRERISSSFTSFTNSKEAGTVLPSTSFMSTGSVQFSSRPCTFISRAGLFRYSLQVEVSSDNSSPTLQKYILKIAAFSDLFSATTCKFALSPVSKAFFVSVRSTEACKVDALFTTMLESSRSTKSVNSFALTNCNLNFFSYIRIFYRAVTSYNLMHIPCLA